MTQTLTSLYDSYADAKTTVDELEAAGIAADQISLVANNATGAVIVTTKEGNEAGPGAEAGAAFGGILGGGAGLLAGPWHAGDTGRRAGWSRRDGWSRPRLARVGGAVVGGAGGGLIGAMTGSGVLEEDANVYAEGVRRGGHPGDRAGGERPGKGRAGDPAEASPGRSARARPDLPPGRLGAGSMRPRRRIRGRSWPPSAGCIPPRLCKCGEEGQGSALDPLGA
ncbi:MAG: hypothetical protein WDN04_22640 [Rhodospirillales bacterium]